MQPTTLISYTRSRWEANPDPIKRPNQESQSIQTNTNRLKQCNSHLIWPKPKINTRYFIRLYHKLSPLQITPISLKSDLKTKLISFIITHNKRLHNTSNLISTSSQKLILSSTTQIDQKLISIQLPSIIQPLCESDKTNTQPYLFLAPFTRRNLQGKLLQDRYRMVSCRIILLLCFGTKQRKGE